MTGFGVGEARDARGNFARVEMSTVNRRGLDVNISLPRAHTVLESRCQALVQSRLHRGRVQARVELETIRQTTEFAWDEARADEALRLANAYAESRGLAPLDAVKDFLRLPLVLVEKETDTGENDLGDLLEQAVTAALDALCRMRGREGDHLKVVLGEQLDALETLVGGIEPLLPLARDEQTAKLVESVKSLGLDPEAAQPRVLQEVALHMEKSDVREEVDRIKGHLAHAREKLEEAGPVGRGLDFLCQELAREFNTLAVKAARADINQLALRGKERVEMFREQVQNAE